MSSSTSRISTDKHNNLIPNPHLPYLHSLVPKLMAEHKLSLTVIITITTFISSTISITTTSIAPTPLTFGTIRCPSCSASVGETSRKRLKSSEWR